MDTDELNKLLRTPVIGADILDLFSPKRETTGGESRQPKKPEPKKPEGLGTPFGYKSEVIKGIVSMYVDGVSLEDISAYFNQISIDDIDVIVTAYTDSDF